MPPVFAHGRLRLYLLKLLDEAPRHGYEVIRLLEERFQGLYAPSAGTLGEIAVSDLSAPARAVDDGDRNRNELCTGERPLDGSGELVVRSAGRIRHDDLDVLLWAPALGRIDATGCGSTDEQQCQTAHTRAHASLLLEFSRRNNTLCARANHSDT